MFQPSYFLYSCNSKSPAGIVSNSLSIADQRDNVAKAIIIEKIIYAIIIVVNLFHLLLDIL